MREADAQAVLLVRAFEEADVEGRLLSPVVRSDASASARAEYRGRDRQLVTHRAWSLFQLLEERVPALRRLLAASRVGAGLGPAVVVLALIVGGLSNALGPSQSINVLFAPMLGMVVWNLLVYVLIAVFALRRPVPRRRRPRDGDGAGDGAGDQVSVVPESVRAAAVGARGLVGRAAEWLVERTLSRPRAREVADQGVVLASLTRFAQSWRSVSVALMEARLRRLLHLGAMALVLGTVAGMYWRGLGLEYGAVWESTFLDGHQVRSLVDIVLGPAAFILRRDVPNVLALDEQAANAAPWIHLWAMTGILFVVIPRTLLAISETLRERRLSQDVPLDFSAAYFRRLLSPGGGGSRRVDVLPYSHSAGTRARDALLSLLHDTFGSRAQIQWAEPLEYGAEGDEALARLGDGLGHEPGRHAVLLFGLAQPPEIEVQGRCAEELRRGLGAGQNLVVIIDGSTYRERVGATAERLDERRRAWDRVLREAGMDAVHVDLSRPVPDDVVAALAAAAGQGTSPQAAGGVD